MVHRNSVAKVTLAAPRGVNNYVDWSYSGVYYLLDGLVICLLGYQLTLFFVCFHIHKQNYSPFTQKCVFLMFLSPKKSDINYTDLYLSKVTKEVFSHSSTKGGDVCALPINLRLKHAPGKLATNFGAQQTLRVRV